MAEPDNTCPVCELWSPRGLADHQCPEPVPIETARFLIQAPIVVHPRTKAAIVRALREAGER